VPGLGAKNARFTNWSLVQPPYSTINPNLFDFFSLLVQRNNLIAEFYLTNDFKDFNFGLKFQYKF
jgi:hypothetical protein